MKTRSIRIALMGLLFAFVCGRSATSFAQAAEITGTVEVISGGKAVPRGSRAGIVVWLSPLGSRLSPTTMPQAKAGRFQLMQKDKSFSPHLLVVPLGSIIDFPNHDPFFHNVFSLFNGKRFDLGLYESGSSRAVHFDHEGVSYIFCNIHPEMSAVVVVLSTPFVAISTDMGAVTFSGVPPGEYELHIWAEGANTEQLDKMAHRVRIENAHTDLGVMRVTREAAPTGHKNKFGEAYKPSETPAY